MGSNEKRWWAFFLFSFVLCGFGVFCFVFFFWECCILFSSVLVFFLLFSSIFCGGLEGNVLTANVEECVLGCEGAGAVIGLEELDLGEALDGTEVRAALIHVLRDVDVANGAILLEDGAKLLDVDVTREVLGHDSTTSSGEGRHFALGGDSGLLSELNARLARGRFALSVLGKKGIALSGFSDFTCETGFTGDAVTLFFLRGTEDITPRHFTLPEGFHDGVF